MGTLLKEGQYYALMFETKEEQGTEAEMNTALYGEYIGPEKVGDLTFIVFDINGEGWRIAVNPGLVRTISQISKEDMKGWWALAVAEISKVAPIPEVLN